MKSATEYELLLEATKIADSLFDGHLTIGKFTTGWKVFGGTPSDMMDWQVFPQFPNLLNALESFILNKWDVRSVRATEL